MNTKYIKYDEAIKLFSEKIYEACGNAMANGLTYGRRLLDTVPPADVKPVVRGKWLDGRCTNCAWELPDYEYYGGYEIGNVSCDAFNFCPHCGADMREGNDER